ncbi:hypothetical protein SLA2020_163710 [Shorea laevis]
MASSSSSSSRAPGVNVGMLLDEALNGDLASFKSVALSGLDIRSRGGLAETLTRMTDKNGRNALHYAAMGKRGALRICRYLVEKVKLDVDIKEKKYGQTPLHIATTGKSFPVVRYLVENGANVNAADLSGKTPLLYAATLGPKKLVQMLITKGADVKAESRVGTPLHAASAGGQKDNVEVLLENHADPNAVSPEHRTPLMLAISALSVDCVKLLLEGKADANHTSLSGSTTLALAAHKGSPGIIKCLLKYGANPEAIDCRGLKPIITAAIRGNTEAVETLVPVTTRIQTVVDWSADGIMKHVCSEEGKKEIENMLREHFCLAKAKGDEALERKDYLSAKFWYIEAMLDQPSRRFLALLFSKKSLCWVHLGEGLLALQDAQSCGKLMPNWPEAHYRVGKAWMLLEEFDKAEKAFREALNLDKDDEELQLAHWEAVAAGKRAVEASLAALHM